MRTERKRLLTPLVMLATSAAIAACTWQGLTPDQRQAHRMIVVGDLAHTTDAALVDAAAPYMTRGFYELDAAALGDAIRALPWIAEVTVHRRWPDSVVVRVAEYRPVARWGEDQLIDAEGQRFELPADQVPAGLPIVHGPDGSARELLAELPALQAILAGTDMRIGRLALDRRGGWTAWLANGLELRLGRDAVRDRLTRFARHAPSALGAALETAGYVDLRYADGFAVGGNRAAPANDSETDNEQAA
ncbi:cell division protein FtsQ/DivIB [Salinisphaera sp. P385]|uniref:Cell division protein FtsQ n=1 Tax=Spectribacter acetivorans TaxID=3075603 RepID=A0ABU3BAT3_9GAMM|nr:cell division protein FtsQ/DivIB [Salinisphaera sp. P385]MDT0618076.1 cell division protein FtsQ/DivIB [Salinisphaera sp. P385]